MNESCMNYFHEIAGLKIARVSSMSENSMSVQIAGMKFEWTKNCRLENCRLENFMQGMVLSKSMNTQSKSFLKPVD